MQQESVLLVGPSFTSYSSIRFAEIADRVCQEFHHEREDFGLQSFQDTCISFSAEEETESEEYLEFSFSSRDDETATTSADEIFSKGQIRSVFPLLNKDGFGNDIIRSPRRSLEKTVDSSKVNKVSGDIKVAGNLKQKKGPSGQLAKSAHEILYMRNRASKQDDRHRTFLPYQKDMLGFFSLVNFLSRNIRPI